MKTNPAKNNQTHYLTHLTRALGTCLWLAMAVAGTSAVYAHENHAEHEHAEHAHDEHAHDEHAHDEHAHDEHAHDEHAHDEHAHDEHAHDEHAHDEHAHDEHAHDEHAHDEHGHDEHGHDEHAHQQQDSQSIKKALAKAKQTTQATNVDLSAKQRTAVENMVATGIAEPIAKNIVAKTEVAVSNYPLYLLSQAVTKGAPSAKLLLDAGDIGHHGSLSPSDFKTISEVRYVVWFGNDLETNLTATMDEVNNDISLYGFNAFNRLPFRDEKAQPIDNTLDPHIWLDPDNAKAIVRALGVIFARANPDYADTYAKNVQEFEHDMNEAVAKIRAKRQTPAPYWAYHDAFAYLESTLNLTLLGSLTTDHHLPPKASQFVWLGSTRPHDDQTMCMVLQSDSNQKVSEKLSPIRFTTHSEDMSQFDDFVSGWSTMASTINNCVGTHAS